MDGSLSVSMGKPSVRISRPSLNSSYDASLDIHTECNALVRELRGIQMYKRELRSDDQTIARNIMNLKEKAVK